MWTGVPPIPVMLSHRPMLAFAYLECSTCATGFCCNARVASAQCMIVQPQARDVKSMLNPKANGSGRIRLLLACHGASAMRRPARRAMRNPSCAHMIIADVAPPGSSQCSTSTGARTIVSLLKAVSMQQELARMYVDPLCVVSRWTRVLPCTSWPSVLTTVSYSRAI